MNDPEEISALADELERLAGQTEARALLKIEIEGDDWLILKANKSALHSLAASLTRATVQPGEPIETLTLWDDGTDLAISQVVLVNDLSDAKNETPSSSSSLASAIFVFVLLGIIALAVIGAISLVRWVL